MIYIMIRKTVDWGDEAAFRAQIPEKMRYGIELWNTTFNMPYHLFRQELKRIAQRNHSQIKNAIYASHQEIPVGSVAVPVDDDDWFSPDLAQVLKRSMADHTGCYWLSRFLQVPISFWHQLNLIQRTLFPRWRPNRLCTSNNHAIVYGPETADLLNGHIRATRWFLEHPSAVVRIEKTLSLQNRSLASITQLQSRPSRAILLYKYRRYGKLYRMPIPPNLAWCEPYLAMMRDLHAELRPRRS